MWLSVSGFKDGIVILIDVSNYRMTGCKSEYSEILGVGLGYQKDLFNSPCLQHCIRVQISLYL